MKLTRREFGGATALFGLSFALGACRKEQQESAPRGPGGSTSESRGLRIAAVSPALAITLRDLGLADRVVARHAWDMVLDPKVPIVGDQSAIDYEALLATKPTHVMIEWGTRPVPERLTEMATKHGWQTRSWSLLSYAQVRASFQEIATFVAQGQPGGEGARVAAAAVELTTRLDGACAQRASAARAGKVLLLHSVAPPAALGPGSFHHEILERLGGRSALTSGGAYAPLHMEDLLRLAPDSIVLIEPRASATSGGGDRPASDTGWTQSEWPQMERKLGAIAALRIPAVQERRVALIDDPLCLTPSSAMIGFAQELGELMERWALGRQG